MCSVDFNEAISILALNFDAPGVTLLSVIRASHEMIGYQVRRLLCMGKGYLSISGDVRHNAKQQDPFSQVQHQLIRFFLKHVVSRFLHQLSDLFVLFRICRQISQLKIRRITLDQDGGSGAFSRGYPGHLNRRSGGNCAG